MNPLNLEKTTIKAISMHCNQGTSDKIYNLFIHTDGNLYQVMGEGGRRGGSMKPYPKGEFNTQIEAINVFNKVMSEKITTGYHVLHEVTDASILMEKKDFIEKKETFRISPQLLYAIDMDSAQSYIDDASYIAQEKMDGQRIMIELDWGKVTAFNRKSQEVEIPSAIKDEISSLGKQMVLDGEKVGDMYYIFDLLEESFEDMTQWAYESRLSHLSEIMEDRILHNVDLTPTAFTPESKKALFENLTNENKEGIVFKHRRQQHQPGRNKTQLKCKFWSSATCVVNDINDKRSVGISVDSENGFVKVGNVTIPPNYEIPKLGDCIEVKYLYYYPQGSLYQPQYLGVRDDVEPDVVSSLKVKAGEEE